MDTKTIKDSAGVNYTLSNHPMFQNCSCVSWQEGIRTFRYYWSMEEEPNPERWRSKSPLGIIGHDPEPPKFIGKGLDIILAKGETEVLNVLAIRPEFTQYGTSTPEYGGRRDHNDYNLSQDLSFFFLQLVLRLFFPCALLCFPLLLFSPRYSFPAFSIPIFKAHL